MAPYRRISSHSRQACLAESKAVTSVHAWVAMIVDVPTIPAAIVPGRTAARAFPNRAASLSAAAAHHRLVRSRPFARPRRRSPEIDHLLGDSCIIALCWRCISAIHSLRAEPAAELAALIHKLIIGVS
jgi:CTP:molybdopterin cytidylyltransferase MocA